MRNWESRKGVRVIDRLLFKTLSELERSEERAGKRSISEGMKVSASLMFFGAWLFI